MAESRKLYELVEETCTAEQIQSLLRSHKHSKDVLIGKSKTEAIENLRIAVGKHAIDVSKVLNLLRESEENGNQHIFYFKARNRTIRARSSNAELIAKELWGKNWRTSERFPKYKYAPNRYIWSDFRDSKNDAVPGKPKDWIGKIYGLELRWKYDHDEIGYEQGTRKKTKIYVEVRERVVCVVRWNNPDLLEIRVPRAESRAAITNRLEAVGESINPALDQNDFVPWDLWRARYRILEECIENRAQYVLGDTNLLDSEEGAATFCPQTIEEDLLAPLERRAAIEAFLNHGGKCRELVITWKATRQNPLPHELRTVNGGNSTHEVVISSKTSLKAVDYVTDRFRFFSK